MSGTKHISAASNILNSNICLMTDIIMCKYKPRFIVTYTQQTLMYRTPLKSMQESAQSLNTLLSPPVYMLLIELSK